MNDHDSRVVVLEHRSRAPTSRLSHACVPACPAKPSTQAIQRKRHDACDLECMTCVRWVAALAFAALPLASACKPETADVFEGEVDVLTTTDSGGDATIRYFIKGERVRMESNADKSNATQIMDISTNDVFVLDDAKKTYRTTNDPPAVHAMHHALFAAPGRRVVIAEAKRVERTKEPATLFEVPRGYTLVK